MDLTERKITKIAREASKLAVRTLKEDGIGTAEYDFIHLVRHHPGITQAEVREQLRVDKGAAARRAASLEAKGYLKQEASPEDGRVTYLTITEAGRKLSREYDTEYFRDLVPDLAGITDEEAETMIRTIETFYQIMVERRDSLEK